MTLLRARSYNPKNYIFTRVRASSIGLSEIFDSARAKEKCPRIVLCECLTYLKDIQFYLICG